MVTEMEQVVRIEELELKREQQNKDNYKTEKIDYLDWSIQEHDHRSVASFRWEIKDKKT